MHSGWALWFVFFLSATLLVIESKNKALTMHAEVDDDGLPRHMLEQKVEHLRPHKLLRRESRVLVSEMDVADDENETLSQMSIPNQIITESMNENTSDVSAINSMIEDIIMDDSSSSSSD